MRNGLSVILYLSGYQGLHYLYLSGYVLFCAYLGHYLYLFVFVGQIGHMWPQCHRFLTPPPHFFVVGGHQHLSPTCCFPPNVYLFAFGLLALLFVFIWIAAVARFGVFVSIVIVGAWLFVSIIIAAVVISTPNWIVNFKPITSLIEKPIGPLHATGLMFASALLIKLETVKPQFRIRCVCIGPEKSTGGLLTE